MIDERLIQQFEDQGACIVSSVIKPSEVDILRAELERAIDEDLDRLRDVFDAGMVHNCLFRGDRMAALLDNAAFNEWTKKLLHEHCIIYAYQSSSLPPGQGNYGSRIHVDCPRYIPGYMTNLGVIFPLDDFTEKNGATYFLLGSHTREHLPSEEEFRQKAQQIFAKRGDMILFHGRLVHAAGFNSTQKHRHSLTINLCRHYMKQRFDLPRMAKPSLIKKLGEDGRRLIGMNARVPAALKEFYLPEEERLYKPGQD